MKKPWKALFLVPLLLAAGCGSAGQSATPVAAIQSQVGHPELATELVKTLRLKYPNLEAHFLKAVLAQQARYPGLAYSLPRHLLEDLGDEPVLALQDVLSAAEQRYPNLPARFHQLRAEYGPQRVTREYILTHYPALRTGLLEALSQGTPILPHLIDTARSAAQRTNPQLRRQLVLEASHLVDESDPGLPLEMLKAGTSQRPLAWLREHKPAFLSRLRGRILAKYGPALRLTAIAALTDLEKDISCHPGPQAQRALDYITVNYPNLLPEVVDQRIAARAKMRSALQAEFPELLPLVVTTLATQHPDLLNKTLASLKTHYPNLRQDLGDSLDREMPGFRQEVKTFLQTRYPDVALRVTGL